MSGTRPFAAGLVVVAATGVATAVVLPTEYAFFAMYTVLQYVVLSTAWNILGGYAGYINFGTSAFFAIGVYTTVFLSRWIAAPFWLSFIAAGLVAGLMGVGLAYLTLRLKGVFFAIATLAMTIVLHTFVLNWDFVGGARGAPMPFPKEMAWFESPNKSLFLVMLGLALVAIAVARYVEKSKLGRGLAAIRDDEVAAECSGVPTLRLKLIAASISGALMGLAGAPYALFTAFVDPGSAFSLAIAVNSLAMPLIGGTARWAGPVIGAILIATIQTVATVTISSELNLLIVGLLLIGFVTAAPRGLLGLWDSFLARRKPR